MSKDKEILTLMGRKAVWAPGGGGGDGDGPIDPKRLPEGYPYYGEPVATEVIPTTTLEFDGGGLQNPFSFRPTGGLTYLVNWNNTEFNCVAQTVEVQGMSAVAIGDLSELGLGGSGDPFTIISIASMDYVMIIPHGDMTATISISEIAPIIYTMDEKFLPNNAFEVVFKYYNGSVNSSVSYELIENALASGKEIKAKMVYLSNNDPPEPMLYIGLDRYNGGGYQFIRFGMAGGERQLILYTCLSDGSGWKEERLSMEKADHVADAAGDTPTAAEFNALLHALQIAGIMATS